MVPHESETENENVADLFGKRRQDDTETLAQGVDREDAAKLQGDYFDFDW